MRFGEVLMARFICDVITVVIFFLGWLINFGIGLKMKDAYYISLANMFLIGFLYQLNVMNKTIYRRSDDE